MKLNPALRTGLIWAGLHQAWAMCALGMLGMFPPVGMLGVFPLLGILAGAILALADWPVLVLRSFSGFSGWQPAILTAFAKHLPLGSGEADLTTFVLTFGAAQWFLVGFAWRTACASRKAAQPPS